jgi:hypothetical protein
MKHYTNIRAIFFLIAYALFSNGNTCKGPSDTTPGNCSNRKSVDFYGTIKAVPREHFSLSTPIAKNDCEAHYNFFFRWSGSSPKALDSTMPPLYNLVQAFRPEDEFAYFPHPNPVRKVDPSGGYDWVIEFDIGNKNTGFTNTRYGIETFVNSPDSLDDVYIAATITYTPYQ